MDVGGGEWWGGGCRRRCVLNGAESALTRAFGATSPACGRGAPTVANVICGGEDAGQDVAGFDRGELVGVAEEDQAGAVGDGFDQLGHQRQVDHRGFVDHDHVERQRVVGVVPEPGAVGDGAEQAVQGGAGGGQVVEQGLVDAGGGGGLDGGRSGGRGAGKECG